MESIITGLRWRWVQEPLVLRGDWQEALADQVEEQGRYLAAVLDTGIW